MSLTVAAVDGERVRRRPDPDDAQHHHLGAATVGWPFNLEADMLSQDDRRRVNAWKRSDQARSSAAMQIVRNAARSTMDYRPTIAITMGDPAGIGPEVIVKALADPVLRHRAQLHHLRDERAAAYAADLAEFDVFWWRDQYNGRLRTYPHDVVVVDYDQYSHPRLTRSARPSKMGGEASMRFCLDAIDAAKQELVDAVVTAPIAKESLEAGRLSTIPGHTELFAQRTGAQRHAMMFAGGPLKVVLCDRPRPAEQPVGPAEHRGGVPPDRADPPGDGRVVRHPRTRGSRWPASTRTPARTGSSATRKSGSSRPAIVDGPRAGHRRDRARTRRTRCSSPPRDGKFDAVVAMYHDQGLIPVKLLGVRPGGERDDRPADHPHQPGPRHGVRHRRPQPRQPRLACGRRSSWRSTWRSSGTPAKKPRRRPREAT